MTSLTDRVSRLLAGDAAFRALTSPTVLLDRDLVIRAANPAYLAATGRTADEVMSIRLFEAFPDNPDDGGAGRARFTASFERVLSERRTDHLVVQRYDVLDDGEPRRYVPRHWVPVSSPIHDGDDVVGILHRVDDVSTLPLRALRALEYRRDALEGQDGGNAGVGEALVESLLAAERDLEELAREVEQLREALTSRATIDQAKGMLMAERGCGPDEAFRLLVRMSNDTNVRVAEVAAALVYRARQPRPGSV